MSNYAAGFSDFYNKTVEAYRIIDIRTKDKIKLFVLAGIVAIELYYTLPK